MYIGWGDFPPKVKRPGCEADYSIPYSVEVKNTQTFISTPLYDCTAWAVTAVVYLDNLNM